MNKELREMVTAELGKALNSIEKAMNYLNKMDSEIKEFQEIAADVAEMLG